MNDLLKNSFRSFFLNEPNNFSIFNVEEKHDFIFAKCVYIVNVVF